MTLRRRTIRAKTFITLVIILTLGIMTSESFSKEINMDTIPDKSALLLIEFQNEWLGQEGKLPILMKDKKMFADSQIMAQQVLEVARRSGMKIIHIPMQLSEDYREYGKDRAKFAGFSLIP
jgi:hypothetical protein